MLGGPPIQFGVLLTAVVNFLLIAAAIYCVAVMPTAFGAAVAAERAAEAAAEAAAEVHAKKDETLRGKARNLLWGRD